MIARLFKLKGHDDLFAVAPALARRFPGVRFLLVGGGEWRERFEEKARALGMEKHFVFTGLVPPDEVWRYVGIMDVLAHLSLREGLPRALPQALAAGKPVLAYDCDGAGEVCLDNETGFLTPPGRLDVLERQLGRLLEDRVLRARLGARGRALVREKFTVERMVNDLESLYRELAERHLPGARS
jgi:glycosyltransferase involved in cell wall biosynthesis